MEGHGYLRNSLTIIQCLTWTLLVFCTTPNQEYSTGRVTCCRWQRTVRWASARMQAQQRVLGHTVPASAFCKASLGGNCARWLSHRHQWGRHSGSSHIPPSPPSVLLSMQEAPHPRFSSISTSGNVESQHRDRSLFLSECFSNKNTYSFSSQRGDLLYYIALQFRLFYSILKTHYIYNFLIFTFLLTVPEAGTDRDCPLEYLRLRPALLLLFGL